VPRKYHQQILVNWLLPPDQSPLELADNDGWTMLIDMATTMGFDSMAEDFGVARVDEDEHLARVRGWLRQAAVAEASMDLDDEPGDAQADVGEVPLH
jgi:hypothetical protein